MTKEDGYGSADGKSSVSEKDPYAGINFVERHVVINGKDGNPVFDEHVFFPDYFTESSTKVVASKYLCNNAKRKETDLREMVDRVSDTITDWGIADGYFKNKTESEQFRYNLKYYQIHQYCAFNSPMYFNAGINEHPQLSACFILDVEDNMESISEWMTTEAHIFKYGSGSGANLSKIRASTEKVKQGGHASGPVSFLKATDCQAGIIKSGGTFRRSAKMACLDIGHPDAPEKFMTCKDKEELKLRLLKEGGIVAEPGYELSDEVFFQNTNLSIRMPDTFMVSVQNGDTWSTREVLTKDIVKTYDAKTLLMDIAQHAWSTGDPGVMFHDNTNKWNTTITDGVYTATNPCGEFCGHEDESCNLAASNLLKFYLDGKFNYELFHSVVRTLTIAQDIVINRASYPTEKIATATKKYRSLGQGFTNLGGLCMFLGFPYDSDKARSTASLLSALITGIAYKTSMDIAEQVGAGEWWTCNEGRNQPSFKKVLGLHHDALQTVSSQHDDNLMILRGHCNGVWDGLINNIRPCRNCQVSLSAPNGTTSFLVGADTSGPEPAFSIISYKTLSGNDGATMKMVNSTVKLTLERLEYSRADVDNIINELVEEDIAIENSKYILPEHIAIFDTSLAPANGTRSIDYMGHVKMLCAIQPFISGAISKTINMANSCTVQDIYDVYFYAWKHGLKSLTVYRDGSKTEQVLNTSDKSKVKNATFHPVIDNRRKMPKDRDASIHKFTINNNVEGYLTRGFHENGDLGEIFITLSKDTPTLRGWADALATITSIALQSGVSLELLVDKMVRRRFSPAGFTDNSEIRQCNSIIDYIFKFVAFKHLSKDQLSELNLFKTNDESETIIVQKEVMECPTCSTELVKLGICWVCGGCGYQSGSCG